MSDHFLTNEKLAEKKKKGDHMYRLNCGRNVAADEIARIALFLDNWEPKTETEIRDKHILELAFIHNMNNAQIARLNDPLIVGLGNRSRGKPLAHVSIAKICNSYFPNLKKQNEHKQRTRKPRQDLLKKQEKLKRPQVCATCGSHSKIELHHIIPLSVGGTNDYFNLICLCYSCHRLLHKNIYKSLSFK